MPINITFIFSLNTLKILILNRLLLFIVLLLYNALQAQYKNFTLSEAPSYKIREKNFPHLAAVSVYDIAYKSFDSTAVKGFLIVPKDSTKKYPVIIFNRGGNGSYGMVAENYIVRFLSKIAARGYVVIGSHLRGSEGSEGVDEFGGKEVDDVLCLFNIMDGVKAADTTKVLQMGWSRGGITNFQVLKRTDRIAATVTIASPADILESHRKIMFTVYRNRIPGYAKDSVAAANKVSPLYQIAAVKNKKAPMLFIHGSKDDTVLYANAVMLYDKAKLSGIPSEFITYPDGDHTLRQYFDTMVTDITLWFNKVLVAP